MKKNENAKIIKELKEFFTVHNFYGLVSEFQGNQDLYRPLEINNDLIKDENNSELLSNSEILKLTKTERDKYFEKIKQNYIREVLEEPIKNEVPFFEVIYKKMSFIVFEFLQKLNRLSMEFENLFDYDFDFQAILDFKKEFENYLKNFKKQLKKINNKKALLLLEQFELLYYNFDELLKEMKTYFIKQGFKDLVLYNNYSFFTLYKFSAQILDNFWIQNFVNKNGEFIFDKTDKYFIGFYLEFLEIKKIIKDEYLKTKNSTKNLLKTMELISQFKDKMSKNLIRYNYQILLKSLENWIIKFYFLYLIHLSVYEHQGIIKTEKIYDIFRLDIWPIKN
ncbi:hypothetical protein [Spiroplasma alleghenense]|uniref:Uncharacterized protein n=1 Tax=Spiroplasma alleghenense TaxID=216931 RepID=A0A345Z3P6_9MOLU|nr:hypothetical protein [Spiroplasma alleghenense]AXK51225.1 hypothetical protein SALLE_v1c05510 [Spiroplasma alleghenense]